MLSVAVIHATMIMTMMMDGFNSIARIGSFNKRGLPAYTGWPLLKLNGRQSPGKIFYQIAGIFYSNR
jgi:hypothetical protein